MNSGNDGTRNDGLAEAATEGIRKLLEPVENGIRQGKADAAAVRKALSLYAKAVEKYSGLGDLGTPIAGVLNYPIEWCGATEDKNTRAAEGYIRLVLQFHIPVPGDRILSVAKHVFVADGKEYQPIGVSSPTAFPRTYPTAHGTERLAEHVLLRYASHDCCHFVPGAGPYYEIYCWELCIPEIHLVYEVPKSIHPSLAGLQTAAERGEIRRAGGAEALMQHYMQDEPIVRAVASAPTGQSLADFRYEIRRMSGR
jgi:hypothetical protein